GKDAIDHRRRVHRWVSPLDRRGRRARHMAARPGLRASGGVPPRTRPGMNLRRWLIPGIGIKRWLMVLFGGLLLLALAFAHVLRQVTHDLEPGGPAGTVIDALTLQFLPLALR